MSVATFARHPKTGLPVQEVPAFAVGDLVSETIMSDSYPAVVVAVSESGKTVWVRSVEWVGNFSPDDAPGWNGYGDSGTIAVDPESVQRAVAAGKGEGATRYFQRVYARPEQYGSIRDRETYGGDFHRARWARTGGGYGGLSKGARYRQDPHV